MLPGYFRAHFGSLQLSLTCMRKKYIFFKRSLIHFRARRSWCDPLVQPPALHGLSSFTKRPWHHAWNCWYSKCLIFIKCGKDWLLPCSKKSCLMPFFFFNYNFKITKWNCSVRQTSALTTNIGLVAGTSELGGITRLLVLKAWNDEENPSSASSQCAGCWPAFPGCSFHPSAKISNAQMAIEKLRDGRGEKFSTAHRLSWLHCHNQKWLNHLSVLKAKWGLIEADVMGSWQESCHNRWACVGVSKGYIPVCMPPCCPPQYHEEGVRGA